MGVWRNVLAQFEDHLREADLAENTVVGYVHDLRTFAGWLQQDPDRSPLPGELTSADIEAYKAFLLNTRGRSLSSVNRSMQSLRKFGRFAEDNGICPANPAQSVELVASHGRAAPRILSNQEVNCLLRIASNGSPGTSHRDLAILYLLLEAGLRVGEVALLRKDDLNFDAQPRFVMIRRQGKRPGRRVPLNERTTQALRAYLDETRVRQGASPYLFLGRQGKPLSVRSVQQIVTSLGREAGLTLSARTLRDTYAASLWQSTGDLDLLAERLGHTRPEATLRYVVSPGRRTSESP
jgi:site-specific recombinase XerD